MTSAGHADGYVVSTLATERDAGRSRARCISSAAMMKGSTVSGTWKGVGMRGNASAPMTLENVALGDDRALSAPGKGLDLMLGVALPVFQVGSAADRRRHRGSSGSGDGPDI